MNLHVMRIKDAWLVTGQGVEATVYGSAKYGPNGAITGKGAMKFRKEILDAVQKYRDREQTP